MVCGCCDQSPCGCCDGCNELEARLTEAEHERDEARKEVVWLKACATAAPLADGRSCRVSMDLTADGRPCLIVTAPTHWDEAKLGDVIAGTLNLWEKTAQALADQQQSDS